MGTNRTLVGVVLCVVGLFILVGAVRALPDLRPMGLSVSLLALGMIIIVTASAGKSWNRLMVVGAGLTIVGLLSMFGVADRLADDHRPGVAMAVLFLAGACMFMQGLRKAGAREPARFPFSMFTLFGVLVAVIQLSISAVLWRYVDPEVPGNPAAVMVLAALTGLGVLYAVVRNHPARNQIVWAGSIASVNFALIPIYERGYLDFIGRFYRALLPLYSRFDSQAQLIECVLIVVTIALLAILVARRVRVSDYGNVTLLYLLIQPVMAVLLFEMMGFRPGLFAGQLPPRHDLLLTDTSAVMITLGMIFIAVVMYIAFQLFPPWVPAVLAGVWWIIWKPWLLHHPPPAIFLDSFAAFAPPAFLSAVKRIVLPMALLIPAVNLRRHGRLWP